MAGFKKISTQNTSSVPSWERSFLQRATSPKLRNVNSLVVVQSLSHVWLCNPMGCAHQASLSFIICWSFLKLVSIESVMPSNHVILYRPLLLLPSVFPSISSVQSLSCVWLSVTPWTTACQASLSITISQSPPKPMSIESMMPSNHLILCCPLLLRPSVFPSLRVFSSESALCIRWPEYWSFGFSISPSNECSGLISFRIDWLDLLAVQGTLKSFLQHHSSKASVLWCSAFFMVQISHPYMTTGKIIALTRWTCVGKVMSLLFNMLSRLVIAFVPRSKHLLILWCCHHLQWFWSPRK